MHVDDRVIGPDCVRPAQPGLHPQAAKIEAADLGPHDLAQGAERRRPTTATVPVQAHAALTQPVALLTEHDATLRQGLGLNADYNAWPVRLRPFTRAQPLVGAD